MEIVEMAMRMIEEANEEEGHYDYGVVVTVLAAMVVISIMPLSFLYLQNTLSCMSAKQRLLLFQTGGILRGPSPSGLEGTNVQGMQQE